ncbi:H-NS family nucleoid-associated regulatory protein [Trinickia mobilis]|uniref:H-NS family nucleoid-associated regulatory protein n=1 Tax=Trinickia mobilis TaxID=2816356 RepID=UPI001A90A019|nr:H-NS family nucleoid-associated regulatory protein [Trinickia mobilis]
MATLEQIQNRVKKLQAQADALIAKEAQSAVEQIRELMLKYSLTTADIEIKAKARREAKNPVERKTAVKAKSAKATGVPRYIDPTTGATWTGRGRAPAWIASAKDRTKFLATGAVEAVFAAPQKLVVRKSVAAANGVAHTGQPKGKQPAKYIDRKTGATWSGRGRAPAWLAGAKDRTKFLVEPVAVAEVTVPKNGVAPKAGRKSAVAAKKGVPRKMTTAKKATVKKVAVKKAAATPKLKKATTKMAPVRKAVTAKAHAARANTVAMAAPPVEQATA